MSEVMVQADGLVKIYKTKETEVLALQGLDLTVEQGELTALIGNSGSGKSTFLNMIGGLDRPSAGSLFVAGSNLFTMSEKDLVRYKRETVGFVWQNNARNLVPYLTAWQNVQMPMLFDKGAKKKQRALELLELLGMGHKKNSRLTQLSGGEQQRVAVARALGMETNILLADEPTGNLDSKNSEYLFSILASLAHEDGYCVVIVTHDDALGRRADETIRMQDGALA